MRILVARMDGTPESGFAPGSITPTRAVPITLNFDSAEQIGLCDIEVEGPNVYAVIGTDGVMHSAHVRLGPLYPALGGRRIGVNGEIISEFDVLTVGFCDQPNRDPQIHQLSESIINRENAPDMLGP